MDILNLNPDQYKKLGYDISTINESAKLINSGMYEKALSICNKSLKTNSNDPLVLSQKGVTCIRLSQFDNAMKCFDLAIENNPKIASIWYNKASVKALQNYESDAILFLEKAIDLDSRCIQLAKNDEDFWLLKNNFDFISLVGN